MVVLKLALLGGLDPGLAAGDAVSLPTRKAQALLAYRGLRPGQTHQRDKLAALLGEKGVASTRAMVFATRYLPTTNLQRCWSQARPLP